MHRSVFVVVVLSLLAICYEGHARTADLTTGSLPTEICGALRHETDWGPPNFGEHPETDSKFTVWLVFLKRQIIVDLGKELGTEHQQAVSEIQLRVDQTNQKLLAAVKRLDGSLVIASGLLWTAITPADVTPAVLTLGKIERVGNVHACSIRQAGS